MTSFHTTMMQWRECKTFTSVAHVFQKLSLDEKKIVKTTFIVIATPVDLVKMFIIEFIDCPQKIKTAKSISLKLLTFLKHLLHIKLGHSHFILKMFDQTTHPWNMTFCQRKSITEKCSVWKFSKIYTQFFHFYQF